MGRRIGIGTGIAVVILLFLFQDDLGALRNLVLIWGTPLAILLALWRSLVAERQVKAMQKQLGVAQRGLLADRYHRGVEMLGHDKSSIRIVGIRALENIALEHYNEYQQRVHESLVAHQLYLHFRDGSENSDLSAMEKAEDKEAKRALSAIYEYGKRKK